MSFLKRTWHWLLLLLILAGAIVVRTLAYGDLRLAVATTDTASYLDSAKLPLTQSTLTGQRLLTTNLLFKGTTGENCDSPPFSIPALGEETYRSYQPCFSTTVLIQNILSLVGWSLLAIVLARHMTGLYSRILAIIIIPAFGFTPPVADWDSILGSESLTFSLLAIALACIVEFSFQIFAERKNFVRTWVLPLLSAVILFFWIFTRDINIYILVVLLVLTIPFFMVQRIWNQKPLVVTVLVLAAISILGMQSAAASLRWQTPLANVFNDLILPFPAREAFMRSQGMPDPATEAYEAWFTEKATGAYARFLFSHPGYVAASLVPALEPLFMDNAQPYFLAERSAARGYLITAGNLLHPTTYLVLVLDLILLIGMLIAARRADGEREYLLAWLGSWLFLSAAITLFISFFADSIGVARHTLLSIELFRLLFWLLLMWLIDLVINRIPSA